MKTAALSVRIAPDLKVCLEAQADADDRSLADHVERTLRKNVLGPCFNCGRPLDPDATMHGCSA